MEDDDWGGMKRRSQDFDKITADLSLPQDAKLDLVLRYETTVQRQLVHAINQLERLQRARKGENLPAPLAVHFSSDQ